MPAVFNRSELLTKKVLSHRRVFVFLNECMMELLPIRQCPVVADDKVVVEVVGVAGDKGTGSGDFEVFSDSVHEEPIFDLM